MRYWKQIVELVIRPERHIYDVSLLGPKLFSIGGEDYGRTDQTIANDRGLSLACSLFEPLDEARPSTKMPYVIYCHGNCGSRCDAIDSISLLLPYGINVVSVDFAGSGLSEGEYVSLGYYEKADIATVVRWLRESGKCSKIGLWGRSMGAASSLMYASSDPSVAGIVVDSSFLSIKELVYDLAAQFIKIKIPKMFLRMALRILRRSIRKRAKFDLKLVKPLVAATSSFVPALFAHAEEDQLINIRHTEALHTAYSGDKNFIRFPGDHNSRRPEFFWDSVAIFFYNTLIVGDEQPKRPAPEKPLTQTCGGLGAFTTTANVTTGEAFDTWFPQVVATLRAEDGPLAEASKSDDESDDRCHSQPDLSANLEDDADAADVGEGDAMSPHDELVHALLESLQTLKRGDSIVDSEPPALGVPLPSSGDDNNEQETKRSNAPRPPPRGFSSSQTQPASCPSSMRDII